jgi:hypothetical protein
LSNLAAQWIELATEYAGWFVGISILCIIATFILLPVLIVRLPTNYFSTEHRLRSRYRHPLAHPLLAGVKNLIGLFFVLAGFMMLVLPGQGLLTLIVGLTIMNYPGKFAVERWLVRRPHVLPALNWFRVRYGRPPLDAP